MARRPPQLTPRMRTTMERAGQLAAQRGHSYIGTEHVLLALIEDTEGIAGSTMARLGHGEHLRREVLGIMDGKEYSTSSEHEEPPASS
jgi:ATP-dependent Clp protease ATP-binding subunit ClpC